MFLRSAFNYDRDEASRASGISFFGPGRTIQSQKEEADINTIVRRFGVTGVLPQKYDIPTYANFDGVFDFHSAQNALVNAERAFMAIPSDIRARFGNDPQRFVEFASNEDNLDELREMGLARPAEVVVESDPKPDSPVKEKDNGV